MNPWTICDGVQSRPGPAGTDAMKPPPWAVLCGLALNTRTGPLPGMLTQPATDTTAAASRLARPRRLSRGNRGNRGNRGLGGRRRAGRRRAGRRVAS